MFKIRKVQTLLHVAARKGLLEVCQLIIDSVQDKNPFDEDSKIPLHFAAKEGHLEVCQLTLNNVEDKNPAVDSCGLQMPLHEAAAAGRLEICHLILETVPR